MGDSFDMNFADLERFNQRLVFLPDEMVKVVDIELKDGAAAIASEAKQRAPGVFGFLRQGIGSGKTGYLEYEVYSNQMYSAYVEFGTRSKVEVPTELQAYASQFMGSPGASALSAKEAIFKWCERKGIDKNLWYPIYVNIMTYGSKPHPFFFPAYYRIKPIIENRILQAVTKDVFSGL